MKTDKSSDDNNWLLPEGPIMEIVIISYNRLEIKLETIQKNTVQSIRVIRQYWVYYNLTQTFDSYRHKSEEFFVCYINWFSSVYIISLINKSC